MNKDDDDDDDNDDEEEDEGMRMDWRLTSLKASARLNATHRRPACTGRAAVDRAVVKPADRSFAWLGNAI